MIKIETQKTYIKDSHLITANGFGNEANFNALLKKRINFSSVNTSDWPEKPKAYVKSEERVVKASLIDINAETAFDRSVMGLSAVFDSLFLSKKSCVVLATTKFHHEDFIWDEDFNNISDEIKRIKDFVQTKTNASKVFMINNACTSGIVGLSFAKDLLKLDEYDEVLVISYDLFGPFVYSGFLSLGALAKENSKPFSSKREGLHLGEAFAGVVLTSEATDLELKGVSFLNDGASAIRPTYSMKTLVDIYDEIHAEDVDLVLAHGTGTFYNDQSEAQVIAKYFKGRNSPKITCSKWSLGHSLGASSLVDVCLSIEAIKKQKAFGINLEKEEIDNDFKCDFLTDCTDMKVDNVLIQSLGFGGVTGCAIVGRTQGLTL